MKFEFTLPSKVTITLKSVNTDKTSPDIYNVEEVTDVVEYIIEKKFVVFISKGLYGCANHTVYPFEDILSFTLITQSGFDDQ
jgi:hypothetical protein